jgi:UMF1 family MFS transporter
MRSAGTPEPTAVRVPPRSKVAAWALWDCGSTGLNAIVATFVFSVYLTGTVGVGLPGDISPASWLGRALTVSGLAVALLAPLIGVVVQVPHRRRVALAVLTALAVALTASMVFIRADPAYLAPGLALLALTAACGDLASVPYNAMLRQVSTPQTAGRISGLGWAAGFSGSVLLLLLIYTGFIMGDGPTRGLLHVSVHDGWNVRLSMVMAALWLAIVRGVPQAVGRPSRRMAARPELRLLPGGQCRLPRRTGRHLRVRRGPGRQRLRHLAVRCSDLRSGRLDGRRGRRGAGRPAR